MSVETQAHVRRSTPLPRLVPDLEQVPYSPHLAQIPVMRYQVTPGSKGAQMPTTGSADRVSHPLEPVAAAHGLLGVHRSHVEAYIRQLEQAGRSRATLARRLATLTGFYRYAVQERA